MVHLKLKSIRFKLRGLVDIVQISCGKTHNLALKNDGSVWVWGAGVMGQLGNSLTKTVSIPEQATDLHDIVSISCGINHSVACDKNGGVWTLGQLLWPVGRQYYNS